MHVYVDLVVYSWFVAHVTWAVIERVVFARASKVGPYSLFAQWVFRKTNARGVAVIVCRGNRGNGIAFSTHESVRNELAAACRAAGETLDLASADSDRSTKH